MGNHFHLVVETPKGNLVAGMKWFLGTYTARFNRLPVRAARRQGGTSGSATCSAGDTRRWWWMRRRPATSARCASMCI
jgi:hypothetical protein